MKLLGEQDCSRNLTFSNSSARFRQGTQQDRLVACEQISGTNILDTSEDTYADGQTKPAKF
jgi:hypothetical protein